MVWTYRHPQRNFPFYSSAAVSGGRVFVGGRDKLVHALDARTGQGGVVVPDRRARRFVAGGCVRPRLRRIERRQALRLRCGDRRVRSAVRRRRTAVGVPRDRVGPARHRLAGREAVLPRVRLVRRSLFVVRRSSFATSYCCCRDVEERAAKCEPRANRQPPTADRRPPTADRRPPTANSDKNHLILTSTVNRR